MLPFDRIPVWALARRRRFLSAFRRDLERYFATVTHEAFPFRVVENDEAKEIRRSLEARSTRCCRILEAAGSLPLMRAALGDRLGEVTRVNLVVAAFQLDRFDLKREDVLGLLVAAEEAHANEARSAWLRMANPFYWLDMALSVIEVLPFLPLALLRIEPGRAAVSRPGTTLRRVLRVAALGALGWSALAALGAREEAIALGHGLISAIHDHVRGLNLR